jgi:hypothetical protein
MGLLTFPRLVGQVVAPCSAWSFPQGAHTGAYKLYDSESWLRETGRANFEHLRRNSYL